MNGRMLMIGGLVDGWMDALMGDEGWMDLIYGRIRKMDACMMDWWMNGSNERWMTILWMDS